MTPPETTPESPAAGWQPQNEITISTLETLKVFSDPLRQQILLAMAESPRTVKQVAAETGRTATKLYYHVKLLEEHGLIRVTDTRVVSGIIEKRYQATALHYAIDRRLFATDPAPTVPDPDETTEIAAVEDAVPADPLMLALDSVFEPLRAEIGRSVAHGLIDLSEDADAARKLRLVRGFARLRPEDAERLLAQMEMLMGEFEAADAGEGEVGYRMVWGLFPVQPPRSE